jgi:hypothetical protein
MNHGCLHHLQELFLETLVLVQGCGEWSVRVLPIGPPKLSRFDFVDGSFCSLVMAGGGLLPDNVSHFFCCVPVSSARGCTLWRVVLQPTVDETVTQNLFLLQCSGFRMCLDQSSIPLA